MDTQPLYRGYEPALIPVADHPVEPFGRNRKVTNLNQDLTPPDYSTNQEGGQ
jgi:hypothetical protein